MNNFSILECIREWIGGVAFSVLLWSLRMTPSQYYDETEKNARHNFMRFTEIAATEGWIVADALTAISNGSYIEIVEKHDR